MFEDLFSNRYDPLQFSLDMEQFLLDNYKAMLTENKEVTDLLNEYVPDICAEGEPGFDSRNMITALKVEYEKAKCLYYNK